MKWTFSLFQVNFVIHWLSCYSAFFFFLKEKRKNCCYSEWFLWHIFLLNSSACLDFWICSILLDWTRKPNWASSPFSYTPLRTAGYAWFQIPDHLSCTTSGIVLTFMLQTSLIGLNFVLLFSLSCARLFFFFDNSVQFSKRFFFCLKSIF